MLTPPPAMTPAVLKARQQLSDLLTRRDLGWLTGALGDAFDPDHVLSRDADARLVHQLVRALGKHDTLRLVALVVREREGLPTMP
jgi:hypothetical protein